MDAYRMSARRAVGLPRFERECRLTRGMSGRMEKAFRVPGTQEAGKYAMLQRMVENILEAWKTGRDYGSGKHVIKRPACN